MASSRPRRAASRSTRPSAAEVTPSGSWRRPRLTAASSASTPIGRRSPGGDRLGALRGPGHAAPGQLSELGDVAPGGGLRGRRRLPLRPRPVSDQLADAERGFGFRAGGPLDMRFDTGRGVPPAELLATPRRGELTRSSGGTARSRSPAGSRGPSSRRAGRRPIETAEELAALVERVAPSGRRAAGGSIPRRGSSRPSGSRSTRSSRRSRRASRRPSTCCGRAGAWSSSATTRSRTASSSASSRPSDAAASARPRLPVCVCGRSRGCARRTRRASSRRRGGRRQPPRPERPAPGRRTARRIAHSTGPADRSSRRQGGGGSGEQAPSVQPPPDLRSPPARDPRARGARSPRLAGRPAGRRATRSIRWPSSIRARRAARLRRLMAIYQGARRGPSAPAPALGWTGRRRRAGRQARQPGVRDGTGRPSRARPRRRSWSRSSSRSSGSPRASGSPPRTTTSTGWIGARAPRGPRSTSGRISTDSGATGDPQAGLDAASASSARR